MMDVVTTTTTTTSNSNGFTSSGSTSIHNSPCLTPVSAKGGRVNTKSRAKGTQSVPQTPISNAGKKNTCLNWSFNAWSNKQVKELIVFS